MRYYRSFWTIIFMGLLQMTIRVSGNEETEVARGNELPMAVVSVTKRALDETQVKDPIIQQDEEDVGEQEEEDESDNEVNERPTQDSEEWGGLTETDKELLQVLDKIIEILKGSKVSELAEVKRAIKNIELYKEDILSVVGN